jgi:hypothetical protein
MSSPDNPINVEDEPSSLEEAMRRQAKPKTARTNFLPIAMPRGNEEDDELEYRSIFEAPDIIHVPSSSPAMNYGNNDDAHTFVSDMSGLTLGAYGQRMISEVSTGDGKHIQVVSVSEPSSSNIQNCQEASVSEASSGSLSKNKGFKSLQKQIEKARNQLARIAEEESAMPLESFEDFVNDAKKCMEAEVAEQLQDFPSLNAVLENVERKVFNAVPPSPPEAVHRSGLPYEPTDYVAAEDDEDVWDQVIRNRDSQDAGKYSSGLKPDPGEGDSEVIQGPHSPRSRAYNDIIALARDTISVDGGVIIIDTTDIGDSDIEERHSERSQQVKPVESAD